MRQGWRRTGEAHHRAAALTALARACVWPRHEHEKVTQDRAELQALLRRSHAQVEEAREQIKETERSARETRERTGKMLRRWSMLGELMGGGVPGVRAGGDVDIHEGDDFTEDELSVLEHQVSQAMIGIRKRIVRRLHRAAIVCG